MLSFMKAKAEALKKDIGVVLLKKVKPLKEVNKVQLGMLRFVKLHASKNVKGVPSLKNVRKAQPLKEVKKAQPLKKKVKKSVELDPNQKSLEQTLKQQVLKYIMRRELLIRLHKALTYLLTVVLVAMSADSC